MPLPREDIEALDPSDPADAAILQAEALAYYDQADTLSTDVTNLQTEVETAEQSVQDTTRRFYAATAYVSRPSKGIKLARRAT